MKKLGKKSNSNVNSIEAYACSCGTQCSCNINCSCGILFFNQSNTNHYQLNCGEENHFSDAKSNNYKK